MLRRRPKSGPPSRRTPRQTDQGLPPLGVLEEFTHASLAQWRQAGRNLEQFSRQLFFGLEAHRAQHSRELIHAIRASTKALTEFSGWARLVDYRYTNQPLTMAGSISGDGGRFNIGAALNPAAYTPFPALYIAEDFPTAFRERFGVSPVATTNTLTADELVLRRDSSFTQVALDVSLEAVMDIGDLSSLKLVAAVFAWPQACTGYCIHPFDIASGAASLCFRRTGAGLRRSLNW